MTTPRACYEADLQQSDFVRDPAQSRAVEHLQQLYEALIEREALATTLRARLRDWVRRGPSTPVPGLYLWGGVGRGKTYLMDLFYECLPFARKQRVHFHRFMQRVHDELDRRRGEKNPLQGVADTLAEETRVLCFDEFFVSDIGDAMILSGLLEALFERGVSLVATSNVPPEDLYRGGLQRQRFLPAIELIQTHTAVLRVDGGTDYRLRTLERAELYHAPLDAEADESLARSFARLAPGHGRGECRMRINGRLFQARQCADDVIWFDFDELCDKPRSPADYIELAREFHAVLISGVPAFDDGQDDQARRFISLVDECYDRDVKLVLSAAVPLDDLYPGGRLAFEFERTRSRLLEMQSRAYLGRAHRP